MIGFCRNLRSNKTIITKNRRFNSTLTPFESWPPNSGINPLTNIWKSFVFTVAFSAGSFIGVTIWEYEQIREKAIKAFKNGMKFTWAKPKSREEMMRRKDEFQTKIVSNIFLNSNLTTSNGFLF